MRLFPKMKVMSTQRYIYCWHAPKIFAAKVGYAREPLGRMAMYADKYGVAYDRASWRCWALPKDKIAQIEVIETRCHNALLFSGMERLELPGPWGGTSQELFSLVGQPYANALEIVGAAILDLPPPFYPDGTRNYSPELEFIDWPDDDHDDDGAEPLLFGR